MIKLNPLPPMVKAPPPLLPFLSLLQAPSQAQHILFVAWQANVHPAADASATPS